MNHRGLTTLPGVLALLGLAFVVGAQSENPVPHLSGDTPPTWKVQVFGALRAMMHDNATGANVALADLLPSQSLVAVGALSELRGEITIVDGSAHVAYPLSGGDSETRVSDAPDEQATLLVASDVESWQEIELTGDVPYDELDATIEDALRAEGFPADLAVPFVARGVMENATWHVIDGSRLEGAGDSHEAHRSAGVVHTRPTAAVTLVGFYSESHAGMFTHMGSRTHVHVIAAHPLSSGHLDGGTLRAGARLQLPALPDAPARPR